jgi:riboflavin transporter FmnP
MGKSTEISKLSKKTNKIGVKEIALTGLFSALAYIVVLIIHFIPLPPMFAVTPFLKYDPKDIFIALAGIVIGPFAVFATAIISSIIEMWTVSTSGIIGFIMNVLASISFAIIPALFCKEKKSFSRVILGAVIGVIVVTIIMLFWNILITPLYTGVPREKVMDWLWVAIVPFNLIKYSINASVTIIFFKPFLNILKKAGVGKSS